MGIVTSLLKHRARLRSEAKAHIKAQIKSAKAQAKEVGRQQRRADKNRDRLLARQEKSLHKQNSRGLKAKRRHERKMAKASLAKMRAGRFNRQNIVRYTAAGRMLAPIALPLLYRGVTFARAQLVRAMVRYYILAVRGFRHRWRAQALPRDLCRMRRNASLSYVMPLIMRSI